MGKIVRYAEGEKIQRARRLYTGVDPDTRQPLTAADCFRMGGGEIARALDVHPHTVDNWILKFGWVRPPWYHKVKPRYPAGRGVVPALLRKAIEQALASGESLPDNWRLARQFGCSLQAVSHALRGLCRAGEVRTERNGPLRRLVLKDGRATAWSKLQGMRRDCDETDLPEARTIKGASRRVVEPVAEPVGRRPLSARILAAVGQWAAEGRPMPTDGEAGEAVGCSRSTFGRALNRLRLRGKLEIENQNRNRRRVRLPDGRQTDWTALPPPRPPAPPKPVRRAFVAAAPDLVVDEAVRSLRRQGPVVFDLSVVTDCAPGVAWSVDGRTMTRDELLAEAARRNAQAIERLVSGAEGVAP